METLPGSGIITLLKDVSITPGMHVHWSQMARSVTEATGFRASWENGLDLSSLEWPGGSTLARRVMALLPFQPGQYALLSGLGWSISISVPVSFPGVRTEVTSRSPDR